MSNVSKLERKYSVSTVIKENSTPSSKPEPVGVVRLRVLVACEYSGTVRDAFIRAGHDAMSCDLLPTENDGPHYRGDVRDVLADGWDLMIAHPPCTHLAVSGARWFKDKAEEQADAIEFFMQLARANVTRVCIENPVCIMSRLWRKPDQIVQPWQFGHGETKATCLWLRGLPKLTPTKIVEGREHRVHRMPPGPDRWKERSRTYAGIAEAMASQWGSYCCKELT
jgi:hypothetical protein